MRERGADEKNEEATRSVEGMPSDERRRAAARGFSLVSRRLSRPAVFALTVQERILCFSRRLPRLVLPLVHRPRSSRRRRRRSIVLRLLLASDGRYVRPRDCGGWLIPPGASLVTHAARLALSPSRSPTCPSSASILTSGPRSPLLRLRLGSPFSSFPSLILSFPASFIPPRYTGTPAAIPVGRHR